MQSRAGIRIALTFLASSALGGCPPQPDTSIVPSTSGSHRPWIQLSHQVVDDGALDRAETETIDSCTAEGGCAFNVNATRYTRVRLIGKIVDSVAGIKTVKLTVRKGAGGKPLQTYQVTHTPDANGKVPSEFRFVGGDNAGGFGFTKPIVLEAHEFMQAKLEVTNFENNTNLLIVTFSPHDPVTASLSITPTEIEVGGAAHLAVGASPMAPFSIDPPTATSFGTATVSPATTTKYTLTVQQPFPTTSVGFPNPPPATGQTVHPTATTRSVTLTVKPPPTPTANPDTKGFQLQLQPDTGFTTNRGWFLPFGIPGSSATGVKILAIQNLSPYPIELIGNGKTTDDCFEGGEAMVRLGKLATTTATELASLYGDPALYPRTIGACAVIPPGDQPPFLLQVAITYTW